MKIASMERIMIKMRMNMNSNCWLIKGKSEMLRYNLKKSRKKKTRMKRIVKKLRQLGNLAREE